MDFQPKPGRIVLTTSADPLLDPELSDGAVRLLMLIRSLAGHSRVLVTLTQSLATQLRRHPDTIRAWRDQLDAGDYLHFSTDHRTGLSTIMLREAVEPPSRRALMAAQREEDAKPAPLPWQKPRLVFLKPDPKPWSTLPRPNPWRETRAASMGGGAGLARHIKTSKILVSFPTTPVPARDRDREDAMTAGVAAKDSQAQPPMAWEEQCAEAARQLTALGLAVPASWGTPALPESDRDGAVLSGRTIHLARHDCRMKPHPTVTS